MSVLWNSLITFWVGTLVYAIVAILFIGSNQGNANAVIEAVKKGKSGTNPGAGTLTTVYAVITFIGQIICGVMYLNQQCGGNTGAQTAGSLLKGLFYWVVVFGMIVGLLASPSTGPSWRAPFANGWFFSLFGLKANIAALAPNKKLDDGDIYTIASELSAANYVSDIQDPQFLKASLGEDRGNMNTPLVGKKDAAGEVASPTWQKLIVSIAKRDALANIVWFTLSGTLASMMYASSLSEAKCELSGEQMKKIYEDGIKNQQAVAKASENKKVYNIRD